MRTIFCRDDSPRTIVTLRNGTSKASERKRSNSAYALPSTGGAARRIFNASPCHPATSVRLAPGCTCRIKMTAPFLSRATPAVIAISGGEPEHDGLEPRQRYHQHELQHDDQNQRREVERASDGR